MTKKMLIDATHDEETRVAVVDGRKLVEFDYESKFRKPLKGSIFLAKVTRVEPSLQAAFVNFGGNRHGFLPFAEIHPDYFRIPIADREALLAEQQAMIEEQEAAEREREAREQEQQEEQQGEGNEALAENSVPVAEDADEDNVEYLDSEDDLVEEIGGAAAEISDGKRIEAQPSEIIEESIEEPETFEGESLDEAQQAEGEDSQEDSFGNEALPEGQTEDGESAEGSLEGQEEGGGRGGRGRGRRGRRGNNNRGGGRGRHRMAHRSNRVEKFGGEDYSQEDRFRFNLRRKYKIQEVIKRGQIMLVQVSKEERGNKGAAVSTYLSLPGRYCVLMPNSPRAGGVSRKIANYQDRARMKEIMQEIQMPPGMSVIVRTAGVSRTKPEINRDLDYLMRLWDNIRELTLQSSAPSKVYEEADLIKRAVRDLYGKDIEQIVVAGEEGYKTAKNFMKMMIPSHVDNVIEHTDGVPLFTTYRVEEQIAEIGEARVQLPSGGYLIINQTEALVAVDVNSGKATKERHIEETALKTNMEAASEIARQLRLRDLGGLVVIDFIDMEDRRNNSKVERRVREALSTDRARIQMSRISSFGLMELSRQRLNPSLTESQFEICSHCAGLGRIRTCDAMSIMVLRAIEAEGIKGRNGAQVVAHVSNDVAVYLLNNKRKNVSQIEARYGINILIRVDETVGASSFRIEVLKGSGVISDEDGEGSPQPGAREVREVPYSNKVDDEDIGEDGDEGGEDNTDQFSGDRNRGERGGERDGERGERSGRRRGRRGGRNRGGRGRREWRDRDDQNAGQNAAPEGNGNSNVAEFNPDGNDFSSDDEFQDAAAHQAIHDQIVGQREAAAERGFQQRDRGPREGGRGGERGERGGRNRGRRGGRGRGGENREARGNRDDNRQPRRERSDAPRNEQRNEQRQERADSPAEQPERNFNVAPSAPAETVRAEAPQRSREPKEFENVNPEPEQKKRGWWNRLTE